MRNPCRFAGNRRDRNACCQSVVSHARERLMSLDCLSVGVLVADHLCEPIARLPEAGELGAQRSTATQYRRLCLERCHGHGPRGSAGGSRGLRRRRRLRPVRGRHAPHRRRRNQFDQTPGGHRHRGIADRQRGRPRPAIHPFHRRQRPIDGGRYSAGARAAGQGAVRGGLLHHAGIGAGRVGRSVPPGAPLRA